MFPVLVLTVLAMLAGGQQAVFDSSKAALSAARVVAEIDGGKLKGDLLRLSWGPDGAFFLRSAEMDKFQNELARNIVVARDGTVKPAPEEPAWAVTYWLWKSGLSAPGAPELKFDVERREQYKTATGSIMSAGGADNPFRSDPTSSPVAHDVNSMQKIATITVRLKGELVAEIQNKSFVPGVTFSWAPAPMAALAYVNGRKRLVIMDRSGRKLEVPGTGDVLLPAWSPDGSTIAWLQKVEKKKYAIMAVEVGK